MFNTTSMIFTRMFGSSGENLDPSVGTVPGRPGEDVWPGSMSSPCLLADSQSNLWMLGGVNNLDGALTNAVWHFNTTSYLWTSIYGDFNSTKTPSNATSYTGTYGSGCFIDDNDRIWFFGGRGYQWFQQANQIVQVGLTASIWTFDTRDTREYELEYGEDTAGQLPKVVSDDFHPDNRPGGTTGVSLFADRKDGTLLVVSGVALNTSSMNSFNNQIWLYNTSLKQWKLANGDISANASPGAFTHYREPCSEYPAISGFGIGDGKNMNGDVYIVGGYRRYTGVANEIWLIPKEQQPCTKDVLPDGSTPSSASIFPSPLVMLALIALLFVASQK